MKFNRYDGVVPQTDDDKRRAHAAGLGTLPPGMCGKSCGTCASYADPRRGVAYCDHPRVRQMVASHQGCVLWNNPLWLPAVK